MAASQLLRLGTIKGKNGVLEALKHNKRELQADRGADAHIEATRTPFLPLIVPSRNNWLAAIS